MVAGDDRWSAALAHWSVQEVVGDGELLVLADGRVRGPLRAPTVLLVGRDRRRRLRRAGYAVRRYDLRRLPTQVVLAAPDAAARRVGRRTWGGDESVLERLAAALLRPGPLTVAARGPLDPATVRAAGLPVEPGRGACMAVDPRDDRRRAAFLLPPTAGAPAAVVKVDRTPSTEDRAEHEQRLLSLLPADSPAPLPLGRGRRGALAWSAETVRHGRAVADLPAPRLLALAEDVGSWLTELAAATERPADWPAAARGDQVVALRGPAAELRPLLHELPGVPSVVTHGDLASGHNVVVDPAGTPAVLDWETGRQVGLPLLDLLPVLSTWLARARGHGDPAAQAEHVCAVAAGDHADSAWLLDRVAAYARRLALPPTSVGALARLCWGHQASMRAVRDELLRAAGLPVVAWTSTAELVQARWEREIGPDWPALQARLVTRPGGGRPDLPG